MYLSFLGLCTAAMCLVGAFTPFEMPWWTVLLAVFIAAITILPTGIIYAIAGTQIGLNVLSQLIAGFMLPGKTVTVMAFKSLCYNVQIQAFGLVSDLKIAHYLKINPRHMVIAQLWSTFVGSIACLSSTWWVMTSSFGDKVLKEDKWLASNPSTFLSAGGIWGK